MRKHYLEGMTDRPKRPRDANQLAKFIVDLATDETGEGDLPESDAGREGGKARAKKLSPEERSAIAKKAAKARWSD